MGGRRYRVFSLDVEIRDDEKDLDLVRDRKNAAGRCRVIGTAMTRRRAVREP
jgi:hypothetical protein